MPRQSTATLNMVKAILDLHSAPYTVENGGKHCKIKAVLPTGKATFTIPSSPSDNRALLNQYHQTRQKLIFSGVAWQECKNLIRR